MDASYPLPVRRASVLPAASFRFRLATDTLAVRLVIPLVGLTEDLHLLGSAPCRAHKEKGIKLFLLNPLIFLAPRVQPFS